MFSSASPVCPLSQSVFPRSRTLRFGLLLALIWLMCGLTAWSAAPASDAPPFPPPLESYGDASGKGLLGVIIERAKAEPFNVVATVIFLLAIVHTFLASRFMHLAHHWRDQHAARLQNSIDARQAPPDQKPVSFKAEVMHFLGEIEAIFGIWVVPLFLALILWKGWPVAEGYISRGVNFTEPLFVVIIMAISATRPVLQFAERCMSSLAGFGRRTPAAWWLTILTVGPLLGSFITEPAAMTISALLLARQFYDLKPSPRFKYATLGLLFVNVSIGGTLTHFAAPPVLMVAGKWNWDIVFMFQHFGWKAAVAIVISNAIYFVVFRREFAALQPAAPRVENSTRAAEPVPGWITVVHLVFLAWTVFTAHHPALFVGGFLFFLAFTTATEHHQSALTLKPAILVGFFLAGLVIHGGLQGWWIAPVLASLGEVPLMLGAMTLTAFNDNAAITYLATLVPNFSDAMKFAVVAGAVAGGGLTVIANAPNPAGQSILSSYFEDGVAPGALFLGALLPTAVTVLCFLLLPS